MVALCTLGNELSVKQIFFYFADVLHYRGRQGADVALLVRKAIYRVICVGWEIQP